MRNIETKPALNTKLWFGNMPGVECDAPCPPTCPHIDHCILGEPQAAQPVIDNDSNYDDPCMDCGQFHP